MEKPGWIRTQRGLLRAMDLASMDELAERLQDWCDLDLRLDDVNRSNFTVVVRTRGTTLEYPFELGELSQTVESLELEVRAGMGRDSLAEDARDIEGFVVEFLDWDPESWACYAYEDLTYSYVQRAPDTITVGAWTKTRININFPAFRANVLYPDGATAGPRTKLETVRNAWQAARQEK